MIVVIVIAQNESWTRKKKTLYCTSISRPLLLFPFSSLFQRSSMIIILHNTRGFTIKKRHTLPTWDYYLDFSLINDEFATLQSDNSVFFLSKRHDTNAIISVSASSMMTLVFLCFLEVFFTFSLKKLYVKFESR